jgi:hypothetical protein
MNEPMTVFWGEEFTIQELLYLTAYLFRWRDKFYDNVPMEQAYGCVDDLTDVLNLVFYTLDMFA